MDKLKPCPFCGGKAELEHSGDRPAFSYIRCTNCCLKSPGIMISFSKSSDEEAIANWNRRANNVDGNI